MTATDLTPHGTESNIFVPNTHNENASLPALVRRAADQLASAETAAEVLEARDFAGLAYDAAKRTARVHKAKKAHDELIAEAHRAQANALEIEAAAKRRLADEYDAAQERGEIASGSTGRGDKIVSDGNDFKPATAADLGLTRKEVHEARLIRDAEVAEPGIVREHLEQQLGNEDEPTRAAMRRAIFGAIDEGKRLRGRARASRRNPDYVPPTEAKATWDKINGTLRHMTEWLTDDRIELALKGVHEEEYFRDMDIAAVHSGMARLSKFVEALDAQ